MPVLGVLALGVLASQPAHADVAPGPWPWLSSPADVERAPEGLELSLVLHDPATAPHCRAEQYRWPGCDEYPPRGYVEVYRRGDPLVYAHAPAGTYDVTLRVGGTARGSALWTVTRRGLKIGKGFTDERFERPRYGRRPQILRVRFLARAPGREDRELCAARRSYSTECSSGQGQLRCWIDAADGQHHEATSCQESYAYHALMETLCAARVRMKESEYARLFRCATPDPPAAAPARKR